MQDSLIEIIDRLDEVDDFNRFESVDIYAEAGSRSATNSRSVICIGDDTGSMQCPLDSTLSYVLSVQQAKECIEVWSEWRPGRSPMAQDKFDAVMYYSRNDAWLPV